MEIEDFRMWLTWEKILKQNRNTIDEKRQVLLCQLSTDCQRYEHFLKSLENCFLAGHVWCVSWHFFYVNFMFFRISTFNLVPQGFYIQLWVLAPPLPNLMFLWHFLPFLVCCFNGRPHLDFSLLLLWLVFDGYCLCFSTCWKLRPFLRKK